MAKKKKTRTPASESVPEFEESLGELQRIVAQLEDGSLPLEDSMREFEKGIGLLRQCYAVLEAAEQRIEILTGEDSDGNPHTAPFNSSATFDADSNGESGSATGQPAADGPSGRTDDSLF